MTTLSLAEDRLRVERDGPVAWIVLNNPDRHNALSLPMQEALGDAVEELGADDAVRVVVLRGGGERAFASGADVSEFEQRRRESSDRESFEKIWNRATGGLAALDKPVIAMIHGYCLGGGLAVALQADIRYAADDAQLGIPAARLGLGYRYGGVKVLVDLVGRAQASEILFSARRFSAQDALVMGLVNRVLPKAELEAEVRQLAATIADNAPLTVRAAKVAIREAGKDPEKRDLERCRVAVEACFLSEDYKEGRRAFLEKRRPSFRGR